MKAESRKSAWIRATSEFVVIIVGVLVALTVDQWNTDRQERVSERDYLAALASDLRGDSAVYANILLPGIRQAARAVPEVSSVAAGRVGFPPDTLAFVRTVIAGSFTIGSFPIEGATYEELVATGNLRLIQSASLRSGVVAYYASKRVAEARSQSSISEYRPMVRGYVAALSASELPDTVLRDSGLEELSEAVHTPELRRALSRHAAYLNIATQVLETQQRALALLLAEVDAEIARIL